MSGAPKEPSAKRARFSLQRGSAPEYFLVGEKQEALRDFARAKAACIRSTLARLQEECTLQPFLQALKAASPVLVTGSSGYLGSALVEVFRANGVRCRGFDLAAAGTTEFVGCVSDIAALRSAAAGCRSVVHTAALHAPNLDFYSAEDFERVNVSGTQNVISVVKETPMLGMVFSSTTSLMNTAETKRRAACAVIVQVASEDYGTPRNVYGVTKKAAEQDCLREADMNVAVLRCSRFFVEDAYDTCAAPEDRIANDPDGRLKAAELLCGTRASLEDMVIAHVVALVRVCGTWPTSTQPVPARAVRGPLIVSAMSPLVDIAAGGVSTSGVEGARDMYESLGWVLPDKRCGRVLDSRRTWEVLGLVPKWNFERLVRDCRSARDGAAIKSGQY